MPFVSAEEILAYVGKQSPTEYESEWAKDCAKAVNAGITIRLNGAPITNPPPAELKTIAKMAGGDAFKRREAPFGVAAFDGQGEAMRLTRDYLDGVKPSIDRYGAGPGIG